MKAKLESSSVFKHQNIIMFALAILSMIAPWWIRSQHLKEGPTAANIMFTAFFLGGMIFLATFVLFRVHKFKPHLVQA